ncbi:MAG TPA: hypothetical protein VFF16_16025, partial [Telluria sp.]|nr:hypothetical protein [Telluria sp.]
IKGYGVRRVLVADSGLFPSAQLEEAASDADRRMLLTQHARFDDIAAPSTPEWIFRARQAGVDVLRERLAATPRAVALLRIEQELTEGEAHAQACARQAALARTEPDDPDLAYLAIRCLPQEQGAPAFAAAAARWPDHPWLAYAVAYDLAGAQQWKPALDRLGKAAREPALREGALVNRARIARLVGQPVPLAGMEQGSRELAQLLALERGVGEPNKSGYAYRELDQGRLALALSVAEDDGGTHDRVLRLAAASDGAGRDTVQRALALAPERGMDPATAMAMWGLALREHADPAAYRGFVERQGGARIAEPTAAFLDAVMRGTDPDQAERLLRGLPPQERGMALAAALVAAGPRLPARWRAEVRALLFAPERPNFLRG